MSVNPSEDKVEKDLGVFKSNFICVFAILLFAMGFPAAEYLLDDWDVVSVITARNVSSFILIFFIWLAIEGIQKVRSALWFKGFLIGATGFGIGSFLILILQSLTSPVIAVLACATMPVFAVTLEILFDGRKMTLWFFFGVILVLIGDILLPGAWVLRGCVRGCVRIDCSIGVRRVGFKRLCKTLCQDWLLFTCILSVF